MFRSLKRRVRNSIEFASSAPYPGTQQHCSLAALLISFAEVTPFLSFTGNGRAFVRVVWSIDRSTLIKSARLPAVQSKLVSCRNHARDKLDPDGAAFPRFSAISSDARETTREATRVDTYLQRKIGGCNREDTFVVIALRDTSLGSQPSRESQISTHSNTFS